MAATATFGGHAPPQEGEANPIVNELPEFEPMDYYQTPVTARPEPGEVLQSPEFLMFETPEVELEHPPEEEEEG
eukprot:gene12380-14624_t